MRSGDQGGEPPYFSEPRKANALPPYWGAGGGPAPQPWTSPLPPEPARFSGLCAGALVAAAGSFLLLFFHSNGDLLSPVVSAFAVLLAVAALVMTSDEPITNRWMAVVALTAGLAPFAFMYLLAIILF